MIKQYLAKRLPLFTQFLKAWLRYASYIQEVIVTLLLILLLGSVLIWRFEDLSFGDAIYFTCITGLSVGYGDITPETTIGKIVSVSIGLVGVLFVGISIAIANRALTETAKHYHETNNEQNRMESSSSLS